MFVVGQTVEIIVNSDRVDCFHIKVKNGIPTVIARMRNIEVEMGVYQDDRAAKRAIAKLAAVMMAGDARQMQVFMMPGPDGLLRGEKRTVRLDPDHPAREGGPEDDKQETTEPAGNAGVDGADGNGMAGKRNSRKRNDV